jgi:hypothetical protein
MRSFLALTPNFAAIGVESVVGSRYDDLAGHLPLRGLRSVARGGLGVGCPDPSLVPLKSIRVVPWPG